MNEAEARVLRDIIQTTIRETIAAELQPIRKALAVLEGIPGSVRTLQDHYIELNAAIEAFKPQLHAHHEDLRAHRIDLGFLKGLGPKLERCNVLVDQLVPQMARALELIDVNREDNAELRESLTDLEKAGGKRASVGP